MASTQAASYPFLKDRQASRSIPERHERVVVELTPPIVDVDGDLEFPAAAASEEPIPVFRHKSQSSLCWSSSTTRMVVTLPAQGGLHFLA
jgi:hypothetical protein